MSEVLKDAIDALITEQQASGKPLAIVLSGHNGSGKSTMWYDHLANKLQVPLVNADRMMLSILPEVHPLPSWAVSLRDKDEAWMGVAQKGVESFVAQAMAQKVPFATETVFSYWQENEDGSVSSKIDTIKGLQQAGYFVMLLFVGLSNVGLSILRVSSRKLNGGHNVDHDKLIGRFPRTQKAIHHAKVVADASIFVDNSLSPAEAFQPVFIQLRDEVVFDARAAGQLPATIVEWMNVVCDGNFPPA